TGDLWSPGYFRANLTADSPVTLIASTEAWDTMLALSPAEARLAEDERRLRLLMQGGGGGGGAVFARVGGGGGQVLFSPAGGGRRGGGAGKGGRGRGPHGDRGLSLVHRLGPGRHDQPGGADAGDGPALGGAVHPEHIRPPRARRADPQLLP